MVSSSGNIWPIVLLLFIVITASLCDNSDEVDQTSGKVSSLQASFRVNKLNFIWSKAIHHISDKILLKRLKTELDKYDQLYLSAKPNDFKNSQDLTDEVDTKLEQLLTNYDLSGSVTAFNKKHKWQNEEEMRMKNSVLPSEKFTDSKLQKLWHAAKKSRFTDFQLKALHKELKNHEHRMKMYTQKVSQFNEVNGVNDLNGIDVHTADELNRELKTHFIALEESYDQLHEKISRSPPSTFANEKVENLWRLAADNANFSASELESIRVELTHFDRRIDKLQMHNSELDTAKKRHKMLGKVNVVNDEIDAFEQENMRLTRKMRKLEHEIVSKLTHVEL